MYQKAHFFPLPVTHPGIHSSPTLRSCSWLGTSQIQHRRSRPACVGFGPMVRLHQPIGNAVVLAFVVWIVCLPNQLESLVFNLQSGRTKCISDDLHVHAVTVAHYRIAPDAPHNHKISARVSDPNGNNLHYAESVESGEFAFTATQAGHHTVCFWSPQFDPSASIPIEFEWKTGVAANPRTNVGIVKRDKIHLMELELKNLEDSVHSIHDEIIYLRAREEEMQMLNQTTNSRMAMLSLLSLFICLGVAGMQLWHLKTFFERKKIL